MATAEEIFSNPLLRRLILTKYVRNKYINDIKKQMYSFLNDEIIKKWYKYCTCELCSLERDREFYNNLV